MTSCHPHSHWNGGYWMQQQPWQRPWRPPRLKRASLPYYFLSDYALWRRPKNSPLLIHTTYFTCFWSERWPQRYLWTTEGRLQRAVATWRAWTCSPLLCSGSSSSRNAAAADGCCNHHQAGGVWGRVGEPSEGLPAREHRYSNFNQHRSALTQLLVLLWLVLCSD